MKPDENQNSFYNYMLAGTINHCERLIENGMSIEAVEILQEFTRKSEAEVELILKSDSDTTLIPN